MRKLFLYTSLVIFTLNIVVAANKSIAPVKQSKYRINKVEPATIYGQEGNGTSRIVDYSSRDNMLNVTLADSSMNGYGLLVGSTYPLVGGDEGYFATYRQWCGPSCTSGQIGAAYSSNGTNWTTYTNLNPIGNTGPNGDGGIGRYPSSLGNADVPFSFWNEYTGTGSPSYGGRPFYAFDEFGWDGGSFSDAYDLDLNWNANKDLWVGSPALSNDGGMSMFNVAFADWTRSDVFVFHSEAYEDGFIIFGEEIKVIDETTHLVGGDDEGSYTSSPVLDVNEDGIGYTAVTAYWAGGDVGASEYSNSHTAVFAMTEDHGATWSGGTNGAPYYYIGDDVFQHMFDSGTFPLEFTDEYGETTFFTELFCTYDFHMRVDGEGNPHFILGVLPSDVGYVYPGIFESNGWYHFWIDKDHLASPGEPQTATGWNYSQVVRTDTSWQWDLGGTASWQYFFPHLAISEEDPNVMYVVSSLVSPGEADEVDGSYPEWTIDLNVMKSEDGGVTWWCPYKATDTHPVADDLDSYICPDGLTVDSMDEHAGHAGTGATNSTVPVLFNYPDYCYGSTTGDAAPADYKNRIYIGNVSLDSEPQCGDCPCAGDANGDTSVDVLDIVSIVNNILGNTPPTYFECSADQNGDGSTDVLDIVSIVNCILAGGCDCDGGLPRGSEAILDNATSVKLVRNDNSINIYSDGFIGGIQMTIEHGDDFELDLSNQFSSDLVGFSAYSTEGNTTTLIAVAPKNSNLFNASDDFEVTEVVAASGNDYIDIVIADEFALLSSYPNPFNPETKIDYEIYSDSHVELSIYNIAGQLVSNLVSSDLLAGSYNSVWNGKDFNGVDVASGVYLMQLKSDSQIITNKITLLR